ncbi:MAG: aspartate/glutamate racemase family protein [Alsobacter sp.]
MSDRLRMIGLIGGLSWESTATYYAEINRGVRDVLGGLHSARLLLHSFDFAEIQALQNEAGWHEAGERLAAAGRALQGSGAECLLICANLMHRVAPAVQAATRVPLIHIADTLGVALRKGGSRRPLLLATRPVMEERFYRDRLAEGFGIEALVPGAEDRAEVNRIVFEELVRGVLNPASRDAYLAVVRRGRDAGADSVVFACTEIGLLLSPDDLDCPVYDTAKLHARAAVEFALSRAPS